MENLTIASLIIVLKNRLQGFFLQQSRLIQTLKESRLHTYFKRISVKSNINQWGIPKKKSVLRFFQCAGTTALTFRHF